MVKLYWPVMSCTIWEEIPETQLHDAGNSQCQTRSLHGSVLLGTVIVAKVCASFKPDSVPGFSARRSLEGVEFLRLPAARIKREG